MGRCLDIRHRRNNNKQEGRQGRDVDGQKHGDQLPARDATGNSELRHMFKAGSALVVRGSARGRHKEDRNTEDEAGSALSVNQLRLMIGLSSSHEENIATGDVLVGLCYFPMHIRQMLYSHLDQAITQTSLFV